MFRSIYRNVFIILLSSLFFNGVSASDLSNITAQAWLIADKEGKIIEGTNTTEIRSIASITKLMTAMVVLDSGQSLTETIPKKLHGRNLTRQTLIDLAIVKSDNAASKLLCDYYPGGYKACVEAMNVKAKLLEMNNTSFVDPTGRYNDNLSTAEDLIKLVAAAANYPVIVEASNKEAVRWQINNKKYMEFRNTNSLVGKGYHFVVSKTGFIRNAGGCIVMMVETIEGIRTVILLGSKNTKTRIPEVQRLAALY